ncbi:unnamed protein product [Bursaphelenchus okinawaensis]|uniref:Nerve growth factor-related domain-containing protein n=1 Tax=Bursaphelenchus okinawaensis TaxID=465554 RepID=A0A811L8D6_9BILA|nr:unnamed protein product [Bursaphelenchus okinawaensis]CAG9119093.1 unnamed protein product [Bursaphelenchus okinawaensis]
MNSLLLTCILLASASYLAAADGLTDDDLISIVNKIQVEGFYSQSMNMTVARRKPCVEVAARNVDIKQAYGKYSKTFVDVDPAQRFDVNYCSTLENVGSCADDSTCATVFTWQKVRVRPAGARRVQWVGEEVLLPTSCMCVMGNSDVPIIIL